MRCTTALQMSSLRETSCPSDTDQYPYSLHSMTLKLVIPAYMLIYNLSELLQECTPDM